MKKAIMILLIVAACMGVFTSSAIRKSKDDSVCDELSRTVYDIVEESYINYGNIKYSKYKDIISPKDYSNMYYLYVVDYSDPDTPYVDRSKIYILISYHTMPTTQITGADEAVTTYTYEKRYIYNPEQENQAENTYDEYSYSAGIVDGCTVKWRRQRDGKWHIVSYYEPI